MTSHDPSTPERPASQQPATATTGDLGGAPDLRIAFHVVGWGFLVTAAAMAIAPQTFVDSIAGFGEVSDHFIRDLAAYATPLGVALLLAASRPTWQRPVLGLVMLQNGLHLLNHVVDIAATDPAWHGPANVVALAIVQLALWWLFRATAPRRVPAEQRS